MCLANPEFIQNSNAHTVNAILCQAAIVCHTKAQKSHNTQDMSSTAEGVHSTSGFVDESQPPRDTSLQI